MRRNCQWQWETGRRCRKPATHRVTTMADEPDCRAVFYYCAKHAQDVAPDPNVTKVEKLH